MTRSISNPLSVVASHQGSWSLRWVPILVLLALGEILLPAAATAWCSRPICARYEGADQIRVLAPGRFELVYTADHGFADELYNLVHDPGKTRDLAGQIASGPNGLFWTKAYDEVEPGSYHANFGTSLDLIEAGGTRVVARHSGQHNLYGNPADPWPEVGYEQTFSIYPSGKVYVDYAFVATTSVPLDELILILKTTGEWGLDSGAAAQGEAHCEAENGAAKPQPPNLSPFVLMTSDGPTYFSDILMSLYEGAYEGSYWNEGFSNADFRCAFDVKPAFPGETVPLGTFHLPVYLRLGDAMNTPAAAQSYVDDYRAPDASLLAIQGTKVLGSGGDRDSDGFDEEAGTYVLRRDTGDVEFLLHGNLARMNPAFRLEDWNDEVPPAIEVNGASWQRGVDYYASLQGSDLLLQLLSEAAVDLSVRVPATGVTTDGRARCWGCAPGQEPPSSFFGEIALGSGHGCGIAAGVASCWGSNASGQATPPPAVDGTSGGADAIVAGADHSCALQSGTGHVICWGASGAGQLLVPPEVNGTSGSATALAAGVDHSCALRADNQGVVCWGENGAAQSLPPSDVDGSLGSAIAVAAGDSHSCAIQAGTGIVFCWGSNASGQSLPPPEVDGTTGAAKALALGADHSCAVTEDSGVVECWGANGSGQTAPPPSVTGGSGVASGVSAGGDHSCAIQAASAAVVCWGANGSGQTLPPSEVDGVIGTAARIVASATASAAIQRPGCSDGLDNDGDGFIDFDGGQSVHGACLAGACPGAVSDPESDGVANPDSRCLGLPDRTSEKGGGGSCGLGAGLIVLTPLLVALRRRTLHTVCA